MVTMATDGMPDRVAEAIRAFFAEYGVATLKLPSGWFGRPYDNWHPLTGASVAGEVVQVRLDEVQVLDLTVSTVALDGRILRIAIECGDWRWTSYGASDRHHEALNAGTVEFHAPHHK
jgi:hypothetical protein